MPCSTITDEQDIVIRELLRELFQKEVHAFGIASRHHPETTVSGFRFYRSIDISVFPDMVAWHNGPNALSAPARCGLANPTKSCFVLKQNPHPFWGGFLYKLIVSSLNFFESACSSSLADFGCFGRGIFFTQPCRFKTRYT